MNNELPDDPVERKYFLKCKLKYTTETVVDQKKNGDFFTEDRKRVLLIPEDNDQRTRFFRAWLPEVSDEHPELEAIFPPPVDSSVKLSMHRADKLCDKHHMRIMSKGIEEQILEMPLNEKTILIETLPASADVAYDEARDSSGVYNFRN